MHPARLIVFCLVAACVGPPAPDAAVCQDVISRLCMPTRCSSVDSVLSVGDTCEAVLLERSGCGAESFAFETPARARFLQCRAIVVQTGTGADVHPGCDDVSQMFNECTDVVTFLGAP